MNGRESGAPEAQDTQAARDENVWVFDTQGFCQRVGRAVDSPLRPDPGATFGRHIIDLFPGRGGPTPEVWQRILATKTPFSFASLFEVDGTPHRLNTHLIPRETDR